MEVHKDLGTEGQKNWFLSGQTDRQVDGWTDGWAGGRTDGQKDGHYAGQDTPFLSFLQISVSKNVLPHKKIYNLKYETARAAKPMSILHCRSC